MIEEPYRWLEAIANRREYIKDQIKGGSPVLAASVDAGIFLFGVGMGQSKVFEVFDRHGLGALGHPADIEKIRQGAIDAAHMEAFNRAPEDVSLKRLVSFGLSPTLKNQFEQIFAAPFLIELILAELGSQPSNDTLVRLHFDGSFELSKGGVMVVAMNREKEAQDWLKTQVRLDSTWPQLYEKFAMAWTLLKSGDPFTAEITFASIEERWKKETEGREIEIGLLDRNSEKQAKFRPLKPEDFKI